MGSPSASENHTKYFVSVLCPTSRHGVDTDLAAVDAEIIRDADRFKMDLVGGLERTPSLRSEQRARDVLRDRQGKNV
jgi:hypothetical protein